MLEQKHLRALLARSGAPLREQFPVKNGVIGHECLESEVRYDLQRPWTANFGFQGHS
jgi:hypothetical protein